MNHDYCIRCGTPITNPPQGDITEFMITRVIDVNQKGVRKVTVVRDRGTLCDKCTDQFERFAFTQMDVKPCPE